MTTEPQDDTVQPAVNDDFKHLAADLEAAQAELAKLREAAVASGHLTGEQFDQWVRPEQMTGPAAGKPSA